MNKRIKRIMTIFLGIFIIFTLAMGNEAKKVKKEENQKSLNQLYL